MLKWAFYAQYLILHDSNTLFFLLLRNMKKLFDAIQCLVVFLITQVFQLIRITKSRRYLKWLINSGDTVFISPHTAVTMCNISACIVIFCEITKLI